MRRDAQEWKETYYSQWLTSRLIQLIDFAPLRERALDLTLSLSILVDDGNLPCALSLSSLDLLLQLSQNLSSEVSQPSLTLLASSPLFFTTMIFQSATGKLVIDPTFEEMLISNNLLTITCLSNGKQFVEKTLGLRTFASGSSPSIQPLE